jgi:hypothetical protein
MEFVGENASWEECKQTKENAATRDLTKRRQPATSPECRRDVSTLNGRNVVGDVLLLNNVHGT